jgi:hypothetical protein
MEQEYQQRIANTVPMPDHIREKLAQLRRRV